jgi:hypothetical protein
VPRRLVVGQRTLDPLTEVRILAGQPAVRIGGDVPEWFRERSAKPRTRVRFPSSPPHTEHEQGRIAYIRKSGPSISVPIRCLLVVRASHEPGMRRGLAFSTRSVTSGELPSLLRSGLPVWRIARADESADFLGRGLPMAAMGFPVALGFDES